MTTFVTGELLRHRRQPPRMPIQRSAEAILAKAIIAPPPPRLLASRSGWFSSRATRSAQAVLARRLCRVKARGSVELVAVACRIAEPGSGNQVGIRPTKGAGPCTSTDFCA